MKTLIKGIPLLLVLIVISSCGSEDSRIKTDIKIPVSVVNIKP
jgi:hypothetical protein